MSCSMISRDHLLSELRDGHSAAPQGTAERVRRKIRDGKELDSQADAVPLIKTLGGARVSSHARTNAK